MKNEIRIYALALAFLCSLGCGEISLTPTDPHGLTTTDPLPAPPQRGRVVTFKNSFPINNPNSPINNQKSVIHESHNYQHNIQLSPSEGERGGGLPIAEECDARGFPKWLHISYGDRHRNQLIFTKR